MPLTRFRSRKYKGQPIETVLADLNYMTGFDSGNSRGCFPISNGDTHCSEPRCPRQSGKRLLFLRRAIVEDAETHGARRDIHRNLKMEPNGSLLTSVRDDRFKQLRICVWQELYDAEIVQVGLRGDLLNVVRLRILNIDHILSSILKPTDQHKVTKDTGLRS
jgi:hypothetical protein